MPPGVDAAGVSTRLSVLCRMRFGTLAKPYAAIDKERLMFPTRREFLKTSSLMAWGLTVPAFVSRTALAAPTADKPGAKDTILVVVELTGGNDGLNAVIPYADP